MLELGVKLLLAYFIGTALGSLLLGRLRGVDIRSLGSGNAGATNAMRTQGKSFGLTVLAIDLLKGVLAVRWLPAAQLPGIGIDPDISREWLAIACGFAVILGHVYPLWFGFRGGKGFATVIGVIAALQWHLLPALLGSWLLVLVMTGYVGLATMLSGLAMLLAAIWLAPADRPLLWCCALIAVFIVFTHRANIARMRAGKESRVHRVWLFRSRTA